MHRGRLAREDPAVGCGKPLRHGLLVPFFVRTHPIVFCPSKACRFGNGDVVVYATVATTAADPRADLAGDCQSHQRSGPAVEHCVVASDVEFYSICSTVLPVDGE